MNFAATRFIFLQKLQERRAALEKMSFEDEAQKDMWLKVLQFDAISSEESGNEDGDVIYVKPLPWRSKKCNDFISLLDAQAQVNKSSLAKRQSKQRLTGTVSMRPYPDSADSNLPDWLFAET